MSTTNTVCNAKNNACCSARSSLGHFVVQESCRATFFFIVKCAPGTIRRRERRFKHFGQPKFLNKCSEVVWEDCGQ
jgi:hypothetical protein